MTNVTNTLRRGGWVAFALGCLAAHVSRGQEFVRVVPPQAGMTDAQRRGLYTTDELQGGPPPDAAADVDGTLSPEETDRLIAQYQREAGTLGPRKIFSAARVGFHLGLGVAYDDNIRTTRDPGDDQGDEITTISGGVTVGLGDYIARQNSFLSFDYTPHGKHFRRAYG